MALWGISTPNVWLGILMILLFSVQRGWLLASLLGNAIAGVLMRHTRSAMLQVMSSDCSWAAPLSGAVLTEQVFSIPGFGKLIVESVFKRNDAVAQGVALVTPPPASA